jgi:hypothetical protein
MTTSEQQNSRNATTWIIAIQIFLMCANCLNVHFKPVLRTRIRVFLGLLDPDPLVRGTDPDPYIFKQK